MSNNFSIFGTPDVCQVSVSDPSFFIVVQFNKAESDLEYISRRVDTECTNLAQDSQVCFPQRMIHS